MNNKLLEFKTKVLAKEVIEGFGFKFNKYWKDYSIYKKMRVYTLKIK